MTGAASRDKGQRGELEAAALLTRITGYQVTRRVRQHARDADLEGLPLWSIEVKRRRKIMRADLREWWAQTVEQAQRRGRLPLLLCREDRGEWFCTWSAAMHRPGFDDLYVRELAGTTVNADATTWWTLTKSVMPVAGAPAQRYFPASPRAGNSHPAGWVVSDSEHY